MKVNTGCIVGVKTAQGSIVPVLDTGTQRSNRLIFTTTADRQTLAHFELFQRSDSQGRWRAVDKMLLKGIPPRKAGEPDLEFQVRMRRADRLSLEVSAEGRKSGAAELIVNLRVPAGRSFGGAALPAARPRAATGRSPRRRGSTRNRVGLSILCGLTGVLLFLLIFKPAFQRLYTGRAEQRGRAAVVLPPRMSPVSAVESPAAQEMGKITGLPESGVNPDSESPAGRETFVLSPDSGVPPLEPVIYRVIWGDTLWRIAERFYGSRDLYMNLAESNNLEDPDRILAGSALKLLPEMSGMKRREQGNAEQQSRLDD